MKVLLVNGSPRQKGNTATALAQIAAQLQKNGIESETVWIGNKPVRGCIACGGLCQSAHRHTRSPLLANAVHLPRLSPSVGKKG